VRRALLAGMVFAGLVTPGVASAAAPTPAFPTARLQGSFELAGRVTAAHAVRGEHVGQTVARVWSFTSTCPSGQCSQVALVRGRAGASDSLMLTRVGPGQYRGNGSFSLPLRCAGRVYARGEQVPFTITVTVTLAVPFGSGIVATRVSATYVNRRRINRTPCVAALGHDAASYHGHLAPIIGSI
jgi:hypothetical protein